MWTLQAAFVAKGDHLSRCSEIAPLLAFYPCDGLDAREKQGVDAHLASCSTCAQQALEEQEISAALLSSFEGAHPMDPREEFLARCRTELYELLDEFFVLSLPSHRWPSR